MKKVELIGEKFHFYYQPILTSCECSKHVNYALDILVTMLYNFVTAFDLKDLAQDKGFCNKKLQPINSKVINLKPLWIKQ